MLTVASESPAEKSLSPGFAEDVQRLLPTRLRFHQERLETSIAAQGIERRTGRESRGHTVRFGKCALQIQEPLLVLAHVAE